MRQRKGVIVALPSRPPTRSRHPDMSRRQFAVADCVVALALVAIAAVDSGLGAALLIASAIVLGHVAGWYSLRDARR
jgi:hypothetical protein